MIALLLIRQIIKLFLMMLMGFTLVKARLIKAEDSKSLSLVTLYIITPCVILEAFQVDYTSETGRGLILAFTAAVLLHIMLLTVGYVLEKLFKLDPVEKASAIYSNAGNLIIPIVTGVLGKEWVLYCCAFISVQLILLWTHGRMLLSSEKKIDVRKIITNINMIAIGIGIILFLTGLRLPALVNEAFSSVGGTVGPVSMIVSGMLIGGLKKKQILAFRRLWLPVFLRMLFFPILALLILKYSGLKNMADNGTIILLITFLATTSPAAASVTQMAQIFGRDAEYASVINVVTTLICIITMPIMVYFYQL